MKLKELWNLYKIGLYQADRDKFEETYPPCPECGLSLWKGETIFILDRGEGIKIHEQCRNRGLIVKAIIGGLNEPKENK